MFDAYEAVDNIIDEINDNYNEACYEEIYNELCYRVESGEMSLEDAEIVNEAAYNKYVTEIARWRKEMRDAVSAEDKAGAKWADLYNDGNPSDKDAEKRAYEELEKRREKSRRLTTQLGRGDWKEAHNNLYTSARNDGDVQKYPIFRNDYNSRYRNRAEKAKKYIDKMSNPNYDPDKDLWRKDPETGKPLKQDKYLKLQQAKDRATGRRR